MAGNYWNDTFCLGNITELDNKTRGNDTICVDDQEFLVVEVVDPEKSFEENGFIGLAPGRSGKSVLNTMKKKNLIKNEVVAINLEEGKNVVSFGEIEVNINKTDLHYFSNL